MLPAITLCCGLLLPQTLFGQTQAQANAVLNPAHIESGDTFALRVLVAGTAVAPKRTLDRIIGKQLGLIEK